MQDWNGIYDRTYFAGDAEEREGFHAGSQAIHRAQIAQRIGMGTMASSPQALAHRVLVYQTKQAYPKDSTGPRIVPFLSVFDQSYKPFRTAVEANPLSGGVKDFKYAQHILKQRFNDLKNQEAAAEGMPPTMPETLDLTDVETSSLELDNLLTALDNSIEIGTVSQIDVSDLKNIFRLIVKLSTTFDEQRFAQLIEYMEDLIPGLEKQENDGVRAAGLVLAFVDNMLGFLKEMIQVANRQLPERKLAARGLIDKYFKLFRLSQTERKRLAEDLQQFGEPMQQVPEVPEPDEPEPEAETAEARRERLASAAEARRAMQMTAEQEDKLKDLTAEQRDAMMYIQSNPAEAERIGAIIDRMVEGLPAAEQNRIGLRMLVSEVKKARSAASASAPAPAAAPAPAPAPATPSAAPTFTREAIDAAYRLSGGPRRPASDQLIKLWRDLKRATKGNITNIPKSAAGYRDSARRMLAELK